MNYHSDYATVSKTMLNLFCDSPRIYYLTYISGERSPRPPSVKMDVGSAVHAILLEGSDIAKIATPIPEDCYKSNGTINGVRLSKLKQDNPGVMFLPAASIEEIGFIVKNVRDSWLGKLISDATAREQALYWTDTASGLDCRCKPDFYHVTKSEVVVYDLKVTSDVTNIGFDRIGRRFRYWLQDAHYSGGFRAKFNLPVRFVFCVVEDSYPYRVYDYWYRDDVKASATRYWSRKLCELAAAKQTGDWADNYSHELLGGPKDDDDFEIVMTAELIEGDVSSEYAF